MSELVESDSASSDLPRLRIHHLLVLTTILSVLLTIDQGFRHFRSSGQTDAISNGVSILLIPFQLSASVCIAVVMFGLVWRKRETSFPSQPGHWVAMYLALAWVRDLVQQVLSLAMIPDYVDVMMTVWVTMSFVFHGLALTLWVMAFRREDSRIWKWGWAAMALRSLLSASWALFYVAAKCVEWLLEVFWYNYQFDWQPFLSLEPSVGMLMVRLPSYALLIFITAATISDLRHNRQRHWSHWLVLILMFISTASLIFYYHLVYPQ